MTIIPFTPRPKKPTRGRPKKGAALSAAAALAHLRKIAIDDVVAASSVSDLAAMVGWKQARMSSQLPKWKKAGRIGREDGGGKVRVRLLPLPVGKRKGSSKSTATPKGRPKKRGRGHTTSTPPEHTSEHTISAPPEHTKTPPPERTIWHTKYTAPGEHPRTYHFWEWT